MSKEMEFFMYLVESYAEYKKVKTREVLNKWDELNIIDKIYDNYWLYNTERIENAYEDIDSLINTGDFAW